MEPTERTIREMPSFGVEPEAARGTYDFFSFFTEGGLDGVWETIQVVWTIYSVIAFALSALLIYGIIYSYIRLNENSGALAQLLTDEEEKWRQHHNPDQGNRRWQEVEAHVESTNPNDWKLAIIEADVMLEKMLEEVGFGGNTVADRLRSASGRSFATIEDAWQAHRVRNQIAHGGTDFVLTQKMAQTTIIQFKKVFQEFGMV